MQIEKLERSGIPRLVVGRWQSDGIRYLLPIQAESVGRYGILDGNSLVISGPGTSGKTFCGEMAALRSAALGHKSVFLVPLKAIAEEKYRLFRGRYASLGIKIALATGERVDDCVADCSYDILISIYEKFNAMTSEQTAAIRNCGCFILDEFQLIGDPDRGLHIELIMAKIPAFNPDAQRIILMGEGASPDGIAEWLGLPVLEENRRPVDLRLGVLHRGTFHYRGFNDFREGEELWLEKRDGKIDDEIGDQVISAISMLAAKGEQAILFCPTKRKCVENASLLAERLGLKPAAKCIDALNELPPSLQAEKLIRSLHGGVAFHHAELDSDQRSVIEDGFRSGEIVVLLSTTTLAWGVNLPAKNVFIEMMTYQGSKTHRSRAVLSPISVTDFHQAAGRAGRLGYNDSFGRAIITAKTPYECEVLWDRYVYSKNVAERSGTDPRHMGGIILSLAACGSALSADDVSRMISNSFFAIALSSQTDLDHLTGRSLAALRDEGFLRIENSGRIFVTDLGKAVSASGLSIESAIRIKLTIIDSEFSGAYEWLFFILDLAEYRDRSGFYPRLNFDEHQLRHKLSELTCGEIDNSPYLNSRFSQIKIPEIARQFVSFLFVLEWINGTPTRDLENRYNRGVGGLKDAAETCAWIICGLERIIRCFPDRTDGEALAVISSTADRIKYGVIGDMLPLAKTLRIDREFIRRLFEMGVKSENDLYEIDHQSFRGILPEKSIAKIMKKRDKLGYSVESNNRTEVKSDIIVFTGNILKGLKEIIIKGRSIYLQPKLYDYLRKLWWAYISADPMVNKESLEPGLNQAKYISKLRRVLRQNEIDIEIVSDFAGSYRLRLPEDVKLSGVGSDDQKVSVDRG